MQAKLIIYKFNSGACEVEFINSLEEAFLILREQSAWPMLLDLAFEPALGSTIFSDLEKLPTLPYVSESIYSANLPENCRVWEKFGLINITKVYPVLKILGHRLLNAEDVITADLHEEMAPLGLASHEEQEKPNYYLDQFEFSVRTLNVFVGYNISTIEDLLQFSEEQILSLPNFGRKSLNEIKTFLKIYDLQLGQGDLKFGPPIKLNSLELKKKIYR